MSFRRGWGEEGNHEIKALSSLCVSVSCCCVTDYPNTQWLKTTVLIIFQDSCLGDGEFVCTQLHASGAWTGVERPRRLAPHVCWPLPMPSAPRGSCPSVGCPGSPRCVLLTDFQEWGCVIPNGCKAQPQKSWHCFRCILSMK